MIESCENCKHKDTVAGQLPCQKCAFDTADQEGHMWEPDTETTERKPSFYADGRKVMRESSGMPVITVEFADEAEYLVRHFNLLEAVEDQRDALREAMDSAVVDLEDWAGSDGEFEVSIMGLERLAKQLRVALAKADKQE